MRRGPGRPATRATPASGPKKPWSKDRFGVENEDEAHVRVWGRDAPLSVLLQQQPRPGEDYPGQTTRLGSLASRLWVPILERSR